jgi:hypothetical protein
MSLDGDPEAEAASPAAKTEDVTVAAGSAHATASASSPRVATHSHYPDGTEEIVIGGEGFRSSSRAAGEDRRQHFQLLAIGGLPRTSRMYYRPAGRCAARFTAKEGRGVHSRYRPLQQTTLTRSPRTALGLSFESK